VEEGRQVADFVDFSIIALAWLTEDGETGWNPDYDISIPADNSIDWRDIDVFAAGLSLVSSELK